MQGGNVRYRFSTFEERVEWLLKHHIFLTGRQDKQKIVTAMKYDGLVSKKTYWPDVKLDDEIHQAKIRWFMSHNR
jgi:hypothetical protein